MTNPAMQEGRRRRRRGGALWWLVALAVLAVILILLLVRGCEGDDSTGGSGSGGNTSSGAATLTAGGADLLAQAKGGSLAGAAGKAVAADGVAVQSVVNESGFWVGTGADDRVFVETEHQGSGTKVDLQAGDHVSFKGSVEKNLEAETYGLRASQGAARFREQGYHVRVDGDGVQKQ